MIRYAVGFSMNARQEVLAGYIKVAVSAAQHGEEGTEPSKTEISTSKYSGLQNRLHLFFIFFLIKSVLYLAAYTSAMR